MTAVTSHFSSILLTFLPRYLGRIDKLVVQTTCTHEMKNKDRWFDGTKAINLTRRSDRSPSMQSSVGSHRRCISLDYCRFRSTVRFSSKREIEKDMSMKPRCDATKAIKLRVQEYSYCDRDVIPRDYWPFSVFPSPPPPLFPLQMLFCWTDAGNLEINPILRGIQKRGNYTNHSNFRINLKAPTTRLSMLSLKQTSRARDTK